MKREYNSSKSVKRVGGIMVDIDYESSIKNVLEDFFGMEIIFKKSPSKILLQSKLEKRLKEVAKHDIKKLMNIAQNIVNDLNIRDDRIFFLDIIEEIIYTYINKNILNVSMNEEKYFFDQLKRLSGETYEGNKSSINILLFNKEKNIETDLRNLGLELIKTDNKNIKNIFDSKLTLRLLDGKNNVLIIDNKLRVIGIARNKSKGVTIKLKLSENLREIDNTLLRYFFYLYINSLLKESGKVKAEIENMDWVVDEEDILEVLEISEELLELDIRQKYREYRKLVGDFVLIEIENATLNLYLNNSLDNYLSYSNSKWKYKSFYLFKFLMIESLYRERLLKYGDSNLQYHQYMQKVIDNINVVTKILKNLTLEKKGALILILKEDIKDFEDFLDMKEIEEKLSSNFLLSKFSFDSDIYKQIILDRENSIKVKDIHFNFLDLLLSIDGAVILDSSFNLLTFGELVKLELGSGGSDFGARTNAAISASKYAIAIKISEDGEVTMYDKYKVVIKI